MRGWLAAPLVSRDGRNIGLIQLSDKFEGEFTEDDEAVLVQLAQMASVAIENARLVEDLRVADRRKDEFLATLAHELRNPLAPIRNGLEIMRLVGDDPKALSEARSLMERQVSHMVRLIDDLMDVSRITRDKLELRKERVDLSAVIQAAVDTSRPLIEASGHSLSVTLPDRPIAVDADATRLAQVFSNLLNNAAKYTQAGGLIALIAEIQGGVVVVTVRDNGVGIPAEMLPQIFDMFTQVDRTLERSQGGLGIGLTLVRRLVEMHRGSVEARSRGEGLGSEFLVRLPTAKSAPSSPSTGGEGNGSAEPMAARRILVVDDNADSARTLSRLLKLMGNETRMAHDGGEAIAVAEEYRPELMLLDIGLPVLNGYDVARTIRGLPWGRDVVIVALTGWGQEGDRRRSKEAGIDDHLVKPVDPSMLQRLLSGLRA
jgi:signal transduction histidine kinase/CheY-like chemotaxis protein